MQTFTAKTEYFGHEDVNSPLYEDWNLLLNNHFSSIPINSESNYSKNNFFEFTNGNVTIRKNINAEHSIVHQYIKSESLSDVRTRLMTSLFGHTNLARAELSDVQLTKHTVRRLSEEKVAALRLKISAIPVENLSFYELEEKDTFVMADRTRPSLSGMKRGRPTLKSGDSHSSSSIPFARYTS